MLKNEFQKLNSSSAFLLFIRPKKVLGIFAENVISVIPQKFTIYVKGYNL